MGTSRTKLLTLVKIHSVANVILNYKKRQDNTIEFYFIVTFCSGHAYSTSNLPKIDNLTIALWFLEDLLVAAAESKSEFEQNPG